MLDRKSKSWIEFGDKLFVPYQLPCVYFVISSYLLGGSCTWNLLKNTFIYYLMDNSGSFYLWSSYHSKNPFDLGIEWFHDSL